MKKTSNIKKLILFTKYLKEEESECKRICDDARRQFEESVMHAHYDFNIYDSAIDKNNQQNDHSNSDDKVYDHDSNEDFSEKSEKKETNHPGWVKPLFRKVVMITHPDKVPENLRESMKAKMMEIYMGSKIAIDTRDYVDLVIFAGDIDVVLPEKKIIESNIFDKKNSELSTNIQSLKQSTYWVWAHSSDEEKETILKDFIKERGWLSKENKIKRARSGSGHHPGKSVAQMKKAKILKKKE